MKPTSAMKVPGGSKIHNLLGQSPSVVVHKTHAPLSSSKVFHDNTLLSESVEDVSFLVAEELKRWK